MTYGENHSIHLRENVTCPHCLKPFKLEETHWIAKHEHADEEERLSGGEKARFLPDRFTVEGNAIDKHGAVCDKLACPTCLGVVPREILEMQTIYCSVLGAPSSGKSYVLASMTHRLKAVLRRQFRLSFLDADTDLNHTLTEYRNTLFHNPNPDQLVRIRKTERTDEKTTNTVLGEDDVQMVYAKPFVYKIVPHRGHPRESAARHVSRAFCLYDNAGEHFLLGQDIYRNRVLDHLGKSGIQMFLFDPTQDPDFRDECRQTSEDPQLHGKGVVYDQVEVFTTASNQIRTLRSYDAMVKTRGLLFVLLTKYDSWKQMLDVQLDTPWTRTETNGVGVFDVRYVDSVSSQVRELVDRFFPDVIDVAESLSNNVLYLPVSATGRPPEWGGDELGLAFRPRDLRPQWVEVPLLYALCRGTGLIQPS
jgi:hypothetical protein